MKLRYILPIFLFLFTLVSCQDDHTPPPANPNPNYTETGPAMDFVHPGILHTTSSLNRMKNFVLGNVAPAIDCFKKMQENPLASSGYVLQGPFTVIARDGVNASTKLPSEEDHKAAYLNAIMWSVTGVEAHAKKTIEILNAYAGTLREIGPNGNDDPLCASLQGFILVNAAEIIRYSYPAVSPSDVTSWENMFRNVFVPVLRNFFSKSAYTNGNWGGAATKAFMGFGVFMNDESLYNEAVDFFYNANDNGSLTNYIGETGQCQESGRDQGHVILGLGNLAEVCEVAYNQKNETLYSASENRLLSGYEYTAKYNLGYDVPFTTWRDITGQYSNWTVISTDERGRFRPVFEIAYNHYVTRKGLKMPYTQQIISRISPEGEAQWCDHPGYGTLLFRSETGMPPSEGAIDGKGTDWGIVTSGATGKAEGDDLVVTPALQTGEKYRGDIKRSPATLHLGNYPILAVVIKGLPATYALTFDSAEFGYFKNSIGTQWGQNTATIVEKEYGKVYYWDLREGTFSIPDGKLPTDQSQKITITLKIADVKYPSEMNPYTVKWMKSFRSVDDLNNFLAEN